MELQPNGRFPGGIRCQTEKLTMSVKKVGDEVVIRLDSEQFSDFWMEAKGDVRELLKALLNEEES